ncbi:hypothetical protein FJZ26_04030 [Candidatus Parvarchaeota archaeon]|nr:hypothetical protein [Candidatus Parvarchaeota archaeon]
MVRGKVAWKARQKKKSKRELEEFSKKVQKHMDEERKGKASGMISEIILGGQDGLVNVLGIVLGVAYATNDGYIVLVAGMVATFAESISMAAVAYTSARAEQDHYRHELEQEKWEIDHLPEVETEEIRLIYMKKGLRGKELEQMVRAITSNRDLWLSVMMSEELGLSPADSYNPVKSGVIVGFSAIIGSLIPLLPFLFFPVGQSMVIALALAALTLFAVGAYKAKITVGKWWKSGLEMMVIGGLAALAGYIVGAYFKTPA